VYALTTGCGVDVLFLFFSFGSTPQTTVKTPLIPLLQALHQKSYIYCNSRPSTEFGIKPDRESTWGRVFLALSLDFYFSGFPLSRE
jgi:hypothetical protein